LRNQDPANLLKEIRKITRGCHEEYTRKKNQERSQLAYKRTIKITDERRKAKQVGNRAEVRRLNSEFQREGRTDKNS
jgi:hypothetical protein